ncbi:hypothetical protein XU18_3464 [Perkinsela sp. CCAP 1560/4]|nr:hypothetical protein XU18_3464 [Perkinsela sp. CCAP 1560/4]|eukprot:KNH05493.1 hypothetical protein XU18_3464 [Perkinsela sp. CCAP 1560/4]
MYGSAWGKPPQGPSDDEVAKGDELVLQSWGFCKAKKHPSQRHKTEAVETQRKKQLQWRKRSSFIELDCGDDSFMVSNTYKVLGVADGVGEWNKTDGNAAAVANKLMQNSKLYSETHRGCFDSRTILSEAMEKTRRDKETPPGSTTACLASLRQHKGPTSSLRTGVLNVINIGNSNAMLIRNRSMVHRAREKMHGFNAPFQLAVPPPRGTEMGEEIFNDSLADAVHEEWEVREGDVLVMATDGLYDNVFNSEIATVAGAMGRYDAPKDLFSYIPGFGSIIRAWLGLHEQPDISLIDPYKVTKKLTMMAHERAYKQDVNTPFSYMLSSFLGETKKGGKPDDVTVMLSRIVRRDELKRVTMW